MLKAAPKPFRLSIPDADLADLRERLARDVIAFFDELGA